MKDCFKFPEHLKWIFNVGDDLEVFINILLKWSLDTRNLNVELDKITIKCVVVEIKQLVVLFFEVVDIVLEWVYDWLDVLKIMFLQCLKLLNCRKKILKFRNAAAEQVKLVKDLSGIEIELLGLWDVLKAFFCEFVLLNVCIM